MRGGHETTEVYAWRCEGVWMCEGVDALKCDCVCVKEVNV